MDADFCRIDRRESAFIGGFTALSIIHASRRKLDQFVNSVATKLTWARPHGQDQIAGWKMRAEGASP
jgi:hypothetical protein